MEPMKRKAYGLANIALSKMLKTESDSDQCKAERSPGPSSRNVNVESCSVNTDALGLYEMNVAVNKIAQTSKTQDFELPYSLNVMKMVESRASEIATIWEDIKRRRPKLATQQLPHHMRRRTASHNAKRVPRRLRERVLNETLKAKKSKRPSRKHRRRPSNLLEEYNRRQESKNFLESHIWFAKRFHMTELWGYKIPMKPTGKDGRAAIRSTLQNVMLQDLSYFGCLELNGPQDILISNLKLITNSDIGMTFESKFSIHGTREGKTILCYPTYPRQTIGLVSFLWEPLLEEEPHPSIQRKLWIWCHPMVYEEIVSVLKELFGIVDYEQSMENEDNETSSKVFSDQKDDGNLNNEEEIKASDNAKPSTSSHCNSKKPKIVSDAGMLDKKLINHSKEAPIFSNGSFTLTLLKDKFIRHRLIGPGSQNVLAEVLEVADVLCTEGSTNMDTKWWEVFYANEKMQKAHEQQRLFWNKLQAEQRPNDTCIVLGLNVKDPRIRLPHKKTNVFHTHQGLDKLNYSDTGNNPHLSHSPIWLKDIRQEVSATKEPECVLNKKRSDFLVPGTQLDLGRDESRIPVLLIQQPGHNGLGMGWDIIAPLGWSMAFWISFIYRGGHASGLKDLKCIANEAGYPMFPFNYPDTKCGMELNKQNHKEMMEKHFRYPPKIRPSFEKLGVLSPYYMPWEVLVIDWAKEDTTFSKTVSSCGNDVPQETTQKFCVLRSKKELIKLKEACNLLIKQAKSQSCGTSQTDKMESIFSHFKSKFSEQENSIKYAVVCVQLKCNNRGTPSQYAGLYLLNEDDVNSVTQDPEYKGSKEPVHPVKKQENKSTKAEKTEVELPKIETLISHCSRKLMGFMDSGNFSYVSGCGIGLGHCSLIALLETIKICYQAKIRPTVLFRPQNSFQYRLATLDIVNNFC